MAVAKIFRSQFPELPPIQDTAYAQDPKRLRPAEEGSMFVHNHNGHWSLSQLSAGRVVHYDSLPSSSISSALGVQLAALYGHTAEGGELSVHQPQVQVQQGGKDCGLFAVAFATSLLLGDEPATLQYNQKAMRKHLEHCLEKELMTPFPAALKRSCRKHEPLQMNLKI